MAAPSRPDELVAHWQQSLQEGKSLSLDELAGSSEQRRQLLEHLHAAVTLADSLGLNARDSHSTSAPSPGTATPASDQTIDLPQPAPAVTLDRPGHHTTNQAAPLGDGRPTLTLGNLPPEAEERVASLVSVWQRGRDEGRDISAAELCRGTPELLPVVEQQLRALREMQRLLRHLEGTQASGNADSGPVGPSTTPRPNVPGYEVLEELGRGGMGVVYKARQLGLGRLVALKMILHQSHASPEQRLRFLFEAELLARVKHPNIIEVHEVGAHQGVPFFALEYSAGGSLAGWLKTHPTPTPLETAQLLEKLARAVAAAHAQGIIHRDLKPGNVLLTAEGEPKISDFGLGKAVSGESASGGDLTASEAVMGTPGYMAPEQAAGQTRLAGPAADIYALGAIAYQLLAGRVPFEADNLHRLLRLVMEVEPTPPRQLRPGIPRDLEVICLKCLQKEPQKRYASALELAEDLRRFQQDQPITARPVGNWERAWRWCRRNRLVAGLMALVVLTLTLGAVVGTTLAIVALNAQLEAETKSQLAEAESLRAQQQEASAVAAAARADASATQARLETARAQRESQRATKVAGFLSGLFDAVNPLPIKGYLFGADPNQGSILTAQAVLDRGARQLQTELKDEPEVRASLLATVGGVYRNLGNYKQARPMLEEALALRRQQLGPAHPDVARSLYELGWLHQNHGDYLAAERCYREALTRCQTADVELRSHLEFNLGWLLMMDRHDEEAEPLLRRVLKERRQRLGPRHLDVAFAQAGLSALLMQTHRPGEATPLVLEALTTFQSALGEDTLAGALSATQQGLLASFAGFHDLAEQRFLHALTINRKRLGDTHQLTACLHAFLAENAAAASKWQKADEHYQQCWRELRQLDSLTHPMPLRGMHFHLQVLRLLGRYDDGCELLEEVLFLQRQLWGEDHPQIARTLCEYADHARQQGHWPRAERLYRRTIELAEKFPAECAFELAEAQHNLGWVVTDRPEREALFRKAVADTYRSPRAHRHGLDRVESLLRHLLEEKRLDEAEEVLAESRRKSTSWVHIDPEDRMLLCQTAGWLALSRREPERACKEYEESLHWARKELARRPQELAPYLERAGLAAWGDGNSQRAAELFREQQQRLRQQNPANAGELALAGRLEALCLRQAGKMNEYHRLVDKLLAEFGQSPNLRACVIILELGLVTPRDSAQLNEVSRLLTGALKRAPNTPGLRVVNAWLLLRRGHVQLAANTVPDALKTLTLDERLTAQLVRGLLAAREGRRAEAVLWVRWTEPNLAPPTDPRQVTTDRAARSYLRPRLYFQPMLSEIEELVNR